jgi:bifunctional non-homologous end joining protein LigD
VGWGTRHRLSRRRRVKLLSRKGRDDTKAYFDVADELSTIKVETAILDGEVVVTTPWTTKLRVCCSLGSTSPGRLISSARQGHTQPQLMLSTSWSETSVVDQGRAIRKRGRSGRTWYPQARISDPGAPIFDGDLAAARETADQLRLEGVVAKRRNSIYSRGRRTTPWLKIKLHRAQGGGERRLA